MSSQQPKERSDIEQHLRRTLDRQQDFFSGNKTNLLFFTEHCANMTYESCHESPIDGQPAVLTKAFIEKHAQDLGIQAMRRSMGAAAHHAMVGDDWYPFVNLSGWGFGVTANLISGREAVVFQEGTSYTTGPVIKDWDDLGKLKLDLDNYWISQVRRYWKGVESAYDLEGIAVLPFTSRSPLDFACDLRGHSIFVDLYDHPDEVEALIGYCADSMISIDRHLRDQIPLLRTAPGGGWGVVFGKETVLVNADPVDLISEAMGERFDNPGIERLVAYAGAVFYHHHSIGYKHAGHISRVKGLALQEILQDPTGPDLTAVLDDGLVDASRQVPIFFDVKLLAKPDYEKIIESLSRGRFIVSLTDGDGRFSTPDYKWKQSITEQQAILGRLRKRLSAE
jgi:hypothetical protein